MPNTNDLWSFAQRFYAEPGVAEACLSLQDTSGADVCIILHLLHLATKGQTVTALAELEAAARPWRETVVNPLRSIRRALRQPPAGYKEAEMLRKSLAALEIESERMQLAFLETWRTANAPAGTPTTHNQTHHPHNVIPADDDLPGSTHRTAETNLSAYRPLLNLPPEITSHLLGLFKAYIVREQISG